MGRINSPTADNLAIAESERGNCKRKYFKSQYFNGLAVTKSGTQVASIHCVSIDGRLRSQPMLMIELGAVGSTMTMRLGGRFIGTIAENARLVLSMCPNVPEFVVNLSEVIVVDATGEDVLLWLGELGGKFVAGNSYTAGVCKRLKLPLVKTQQSKPKVLAMRKKPRAKSASCTAGCQFPGSIGKETLRPTSST